MKNILLIIVLLLFGCQTKKKNSDNYLKIKVVENDVKIYPKSVSFDKTQAIYQKLAKVNIINESEDISIFLTYGRLFPLLRSIGKRSNSVITHPDPANFSKIYLKKNDSTTIYVVYDAECDTVLINLFWKRDSLESDMLKFYTTSKGELKYHSSRKKISGNQLDESYRWYKDKPLLRDEY